MNDAIKIREMPGTWVVRAGGAVLGETRKATELSEKGRDPVIYFPREDLAMALLDPSPTRTTCPFKGEAVYYSIQAKSGLIPDAGWSYETPHDAAAAIAGHIAFFADKARSKKSEPGLGYSESIAPGPGRALRTSTHAARPHGPPAWPSARGAAARGDVVARSLLPEHGQCRVNRAGINRALTIQSIVFTT